MFDFDEEGARPVHRGRLRRAVTEEAQKQEGHPFYFQRAEQPDRLLLGRLQPFMPRLFPHGERRKEHDADDALQDADDEIAVVPGSVREGIAHHEGGDDGPHAPEAVQPAHVAGGVVQGDIVVERRVDGARSEAVGDAEDEQHPELGAEREPDERDRRQKDAHDGDGSRAEFMDETVGKQARDDGPARDDHGDDAHVRDGHVKFKVDDGPSRA